MDGPHSSYSCLEIHICWKVERILKKCSLRLEALAVDDGWAALVVLLLGDPHLLDGGGSQGGDLLLHAVSNTGVQGGASGHDGVGVQVLPDVNVSLLDGVVGGLVDAPGLHF